VIVWGRGREYQVIVKMDEVIKHDNEIKADRIDYKIKRMRRCK